jgi:hypothetical protein
MKVPFTTALSFPTLSPLLTAGKNKVGYFLGRPHTYSIVHCKTGIFRIGERVSGSPQYVYHCHEVDGTDLVTDMLTVTKTVMISSLWIFIYTESPSCPVSIEDLM